MSTFTKETKLVDLLAEKKRLQDAISVKQDHPSEQDRLASKTKLELDAKRTETNGVGQSIKKTENDILFLQQRQRAGQRYRSFTKSEINNQQQIADMKAKKEAKEKELVDSNKLLSAALIKYQTELEVSKIQLALLEKQFDIVYPGSLFELMDQLAAISKLEGKINNEMNKVDMISTIMSDHKTSAYHQRYKFDDQLSSLEKKGEHLTDMATKQWIAEEMKHGAHSKLMEHKLEQIMYHVRSVKHYMWFIHEHDEKSSSSYWCEYLNAARKRIDNCWSARYTLPIIQRDELTTLKQYVDTDGFWIWSKGEGRLIGLLFNKERNSWEQQYYYELSTFASVKKIFDSMAASTVPVINLGSIDKSGYTHVDLDKIA